MVHVHVNHLEQESMLKGSILHPPPSPQSKRLVVAKICTIYSKHTEDICNVEHLALLGPASISDQACMQFTFIRMYRFV